MLGWLVNFIADEFLVVALPRTLVLRNQRLGIFYKVLQVVFLIAAALYSVYSGVFFQHNLVKEWGVNVWHVANPVQAAATGAQAGPECDNLAVYAYEGDPMFSYAPTSCKAVPNEEAGRMHGDKLFVPTFVNEETVWDRCGANVSEKCKGYSSEVVYTQANGRCACTLKEQFLVQNADEQHIRFVYGYEADVSGGKRSDLRHGGIVSSMASKEASHQMEEQKSNLVTQFFSVDGSECSFGGRSRWEHSDAVGGITGTLNELLACAGVTLDSDPKTLVAGTLAAPPHLRTMGFKLQMHLFIHEDALFGIKCDVRVVAIPVTSALWDNAAQPFVIPEIGASTRRTQRVHGVLIDVHMTGSIKTFSGSQVVRGCVDIAVVLTLPSIIVQFVAMYLLGLVSDVYRHTARTKLNIFAKFHNTMAKLMLAEVAFRGLVGKWDGRTGDLGYLSPHRLLQRLEDIFEESCRTGELGKEELVKMASVVFTSMDEDGNGQIGCSEFIEACTNDGEISLHRMANFFNAKQPKQFLRRLFDDTDTMASTVAKNSSDISFEESRKNIVLSSGLVGSHTTPFEALQSIGKSLSLHIMGSADAPAVDDIDPTVPDVSDSMVNPEMSPRVDSEETKDVPPSIVASQDILAAHETTLVMLEKRMQDLELHCEQALSVLRVSVEPPHVTLRQASHNSICPMLSSRSGTSSCSRFEPACDFASWHSSFPDQPPAHATNDMCLPVLG